MPTPHFRLNSNKDEPRSLLKYMLSVLIFKKLWTTGKMTREKTKFIWISEMVNLMLYLGKF